MNNIEKLINDVIIQLDKDPMEQMVDTETIIRNYTSAIIKEYHDNLVVVND